MIHPSTLCRLLHFSFETGDLFWKPRPREFFVSDKAWKAWNTRYPHSPALAHVDHQGYRYGSVLGESWAAHRVIWLMTKREMPDQIDHINGHRSDNRLCNLRSVTNAENCKNRGMRSDNTSGVVGVYWLKRQKKWIARIFVDGRDKTLGRFEEFADAVTARREAEAQYGFHKNHGKRPAKRSRK